MTAKKIGEGKAALLSFAVYELSGEVLSENTRSEVEVSSGAYDAVSQQRTVTSKTTRYQTIMLRKDDGTEHAVELKNMLLPCSAGQRVTLWRLGRGMWFRAVNHNTRQQVGNPDLGSELFAFGSAVFAGLATFLVLMRMNPYPGEITMDWIGISVFMAVGGFLVGWAVGAIMASKRKAAIIALVAQRESGQQSGGGLGG